jgi:hypothetical protein
MCFDFLYNVVLKHFPLQEELCEILLKMYIDHQVKCPLFLLDFNENWICSKDFQKNTQIYENASSGSRFVPCGQTDRHDEASNRFCAILRKATNKCWHLEFTQSKMKSYHTEHAIILKEYYDRHCPFCETSRTTKSTWRSGVKLLVFVMQILYISQWVKKRNF